MPYNVRLDMRAELEEILADPPRCQDRQEYIGALAHLALPALQGLVAALRPSASSLPWPVDVLDTAERFPHLVANLRDLVPQLHFQLRTLYGRYTSVQRMSDGTVVRGDALGKVLPALDVLGNGLHGLAWEIDLLRRVTRGIEVQRRPTRTEHHLPPPSWPEEPHREGEDRRFER